MTSNFNPYAKHETRQTYYNEKDSIHIARKTSRIHNFEHLFQTIQKAENGYMVGNSMQASHVTPILRQLCICLPFVQTSNAYGNRRRDRAPQDISQVYRRVRKRRFLQKNTAPYFSFDSICRCIWTTTNANVGRTWMFSVIIARLAHGLVY